VWKPQSWLNSLRIRAYFTENKVVAGPAAASDVCNSYFCGELQAYMTGGDAVTPALIIAGVGDKMRTSPILMP
jgi:hypothetical protein